VGAFVRKNRRPPQCPARNLLDVSYPNSVADLRYSRGHRPRRSQSVFVTLELGRRGVNKLPDTSNPFAPGMCRSRPVPFPEPVSNVESAHEACPVEAPAMRPDQ